MNSAIRMGISIRFKRKTTTVFLVVDAMDSLSKIKGRLSPLLDLSAESMVFISDDKVSELKPDTLSVGHARLRENQIVYVTTQGETVQ